MKMQIILTGVVHGVQLTMDLKQAVFQNFAGKAIFNNETCDHVEDNVYNMVFMNNQDRPAMSLENVLVAEIGLENIGAIYQPEIQIQKAFNASGGDVPVTVTIEPYTQWGCKILIKFV